MDKLGFMEPIRDHSTGDAGLLEMAVERTPHERPAAVDGAPEVSGHEIISRLGEDTQSNQLQIVRLKKRKLLLKDEMSRLESILVPDIIA